MQRAVPKEPLAPRSSGIVYPRSHTYSCSVSRTHPDWQIRLPACWSREMTLFIRPSEMTTSSFTGTEPPTRPVFPPCGTTAILR
eukprot:scaffold2657_cov33-Tisochrysis_lutea.AAC.2